MIADYHPIDMGRVITAGDTNAINSANAQQLTDINAILAQYTDTIQSGLQQYNQTSGGIQGAIDKSNQLIGESTYTPGTVDMSNYQPYMQNGGLASNELAALSGLGPNALNAQQINDRYLNSAAVQAQMAQGNNQINSNYSAKGLLGSGSLLKALQGFGQGLASQTIGSAQENLYKQAQLGSQTANQYAASLLNKYSTDVQGQNAARANQATLLNGQSSLYGQMNTNNSAYSTLLGSSAQNAATIGAQAAADRQSALVNAATKTTLTQGYSNSPVFTGSSGDRMLKGTSF
jgi:hypothetical protein